MPTKKNIVIAELLDLCCAPPETILQLLLQEESVLPTGVLHKFALWCAETALAEAKVKGPECRNALQAKQLWLDGKITDEELITARVAINAWQLGAVWSAAEGAARYATWYATTLTLDAAEAARYAAWYAAETAVWSAAMLEDRESIAALATDWDAIKVAAWDDTRNTFWNVARTEQLAKLKEMLRSY